MERFPGSLIPTLAAAHIAARTAVSARPMFRAAAPAFPRRAENPRGACEIYHYNTDGTLDWGYFQINTVHLKRAGVNLRDLLDCKANIDFAYQLYRERGFEPWTTYTSGLYRNYLRDP